MSLEINLFSNPFSSKYFSINENNIIYHDTEMAVADVVGFAYGKIITKSVGVTRNVEYALRLKDNSEDEISFKFYTTGDRELKGEHAYDLITIYLWRYFGNRILNEIIQKISQEQPVMIGDCIIKSEGIQISTAPLIGQSAIYFVKWNEVSYEVDNGALVVRSHNERKAKSTMELKSVYNAHILLSILNEIRFYQLTNWKIPKPLIS